MRFNITLIAAFTLALLKSSTAHGALLYGSDVVDDNLVLIDTTTLKGQVVGPFGPSGSSFAMTALAYDGIGEVLYGLGPSTDSIYTIDRFTGHASPLVAIATGGNPNGLAFDAIDRVLYVSDTVSNGLYRYEIITEQLQLIGTISGVSNVEGLSYDSANRVLYGLADAENRIVRIDTATAQAVALPILLTAGLWRGLEFDPDSDVLFATRVNVGAVLTRIDPTTGITVDIGPITGEGRFDFIQGLAVVPEPSLPASLMIGGASLLAMRRRKSTRVLGSL